MNVVLDTNVLVSGFTRGRRGTPPAIIADAVLARRFTLMLSEHILGEVQSALVLTYFLKRNSHEQRDDIIQSLREIGTFVVPDPTVAGVASHRHDDPVIGTAVAGNAKYLVTGDAELLALSTYRDVRIISPVAFVNEVLESDSD